MSHCAAVLICISEVSGVRTILSDLINGMSSTGPLGPTQAGTTGKVSKSQQHQQQSSLTPHPPQIPQPSTHLVFGTIGYKLASVRLLSAYLMLANEHRLAHVAAISGTGINANGEGSGILATDVNIAGAEVGGKDKAQKSPKAKKKSTVVMTTAGTRSTDSTTDSEDEDDATSSVYSDSETDESDEEDDEDDEESDILTESDEDDLDLEDEAEEAFEVIARVLPEFYPLLTRNLCRLLAVNDKFILHNVWQCLECLFSVSLVFHFPYIPHSILFTDPISLS
ncbi:unnamed protein product [Protopolystoma xenopodis]|uniref:Uncharacterized protein n=1 Tax=Protopolystoma xenopodis TaxID=117903 RepID=A0A448X1R5_9PLAT|nr:unnamed protein product [Protopolystoma xenopodis]